LTPKEVAIKLEQAIQEATEALNAVLEKTQNSIYRLAVSKLRELDIDPDGYIRPSSENRKIIRGVNKAFDEGLAKGGYIEGLNQFTKTIQVLDSLNAGYFEGIGKAFNAQSTSINALQKQTISSIESLLLNNGLESQIKTPLSNILFQNVTSGGSYSGMLEQVKVYFVGDENEGKLMHYVKQITRDALNNYSRSYQSSIGNALGLEFYQYVGGLMPESREFCRDRVNGYFHYKEIESWANLEWKGKRPDTTESSIFIYAGGFSCQHQIMPVSTSIVPKQWIDRAVDLGVYLQKS
jgi:hypothetical protein